jgi:peptidoglycan hydrolase CwlO-like protein
METERKSVIIGITVVLLVLVALATGLIIFKDKAQIEQLYQQNEKLSSTIEVRDSLVNEMTNTFDEIEQNLTFVRNKRDQMISVPQEGGQNSKEILVADIKLMNEMLEESSKKIEELDKKLSASGVQIKSFKNKIAQFTKNIEEQDNLIQQLKAELEDRDYKISQMDRTIVELRGDIAVKDDSIQTKSQVIAEKSRTITEKENQLNKAYFVAGTVNQLVQNGVLDKEGGLLGIGKNKTISDNLNESYFTQLDIRNANQIPINKKKAKLISEHPNNSYRLVEENDKIAYLEIENPEEFWKITKYAIVETK